MINDDDQKNGPNDGQNGGPNNCQNGDWDEMASLWRTQDISVPKDLSKKIRQKTIQMYLIFGFEALVGLFGVIIGFWLLFTREDDFSRYFGYFAIVASISSVVISWWIRRGIWSGQSSGTLDQVELSIKRAKASIKYANFNLISVAVMLFLFVVFYISASGLLGDKYEEKGAKLLLASAIMVASMFVVTVSSIIYKKKKQKEFGFFSNLLKQLKDEEE